ncbi:MAG: zinc dependent phospholipase C family protein [Saprospiraceae bacterium]
MKAFFWTGLLGLTLLLASSYDWGFFGHRKINHLAVFTLPQEMIGLYKNNIDFITEEAVGPDKRRYASKFEGIRHYMDLDKWGEAPFPDLPRNWTDALCHYTAYKMLTAKGDTITFDPLKSEAKPEKVRGYKWFFIQNISPQYYEEEWLVEKDSLAKFFVLPKRNIVKVWAEDRLSPHGVLPYNLIRMQKRLTEYFQEGDVYKILRTSADFGHYIADAHVPLHTTENYNGQMTNQVGIHAFWETRLPELFAEKDYDFFVGGAEYIRNPEKYFWDIVLESHTMVKTVLEGEKNLSEEFPEDKQYCMVERGATLVPLECEEYAQAYHNLMDGMVESRMRSAIKAIGDAWYTAWVDAGKPALEGMEKWQDTESQTELEEIEKAYQKGQIKGREHQN